MKWKSFFSALFAVGFILSIQVENANAFFTTYVEARGSYEVSYKRETHLEETFENWNKYIKVTNEENAVPVYVRVKAFAGADYTLSYDGNGWIEKEGYYYYDQVLYAGQTTEAMRIFIDNIPVNPKPEQNFNVVVIYETIPVQYQQNHEIISPVDADWDRVITSVSETAITDKGGRGE